MSESASAPAIDKSTWGPGEWQDEPDRVDWVAHGLACFALRHPRYGYWCGYVGVPREHPLYGKDWTKDSAIGALDVHGGIDYSAACDGVICHIPAPGMSDDVWWLGFDCGHALDLSPGLAARERAMKLPDFPVPECMRETYRALPYVREQVDRLAAQLAAQGSANEVRRHEVRRRGFLYPAHRRAARTLGLQAQLNGHLISR